MNNTPVWQRWLPPYDPRLVDGANVTQDEHGRLIEAADCGTRCPGCGLCCAGYRDVITADTYAGVEEYEDNLKLTRGGLVLQRNIGQSGESGQPGFTMGHVGNEVPFLIIQDQFQGRGHVQNRFGQNADRQQADLIDRQSRR